MYKVPIKRFNISLLYLIIIGEIIFSLPFHISRFFRPSLIQEYGYDNTKLGLAFSIYGMTALFSYIPGGYIADKLMPKNLLFISLLFTSFGGVFFLFNPSFLWLCTIYGFWGITTILFFWAALIKATRDIAGKNQGFSFGILEGGRGLVASFCASIAVILYSSDLIVNLFLNIFSKNISSLTVVIGFYTLITFLSSFMILLFLEESENKVNKIKNKFSINVIFKNIKPIFCISLIVLSAYAGYKGIDYYSLYFFDILQYSKEKSALVVSNLSYLRPISAILAGVIADRITSKLSSKIMFILLIISYSCFSFLNMDSKLIFLLFVNFTISMIAIFAMRGIFYSLLKETSIPISITGISVGIIYLIGYLPDVFIGPVFGYFLDQKDGIESFKFCFRFLLLITIIGFLATLLISEKRKN